LEPWRRKKCLSRNPIQIIFFFFFFFCKSNESKFQTKETEKTVAQQGCQMVSFQTKNPNFGKFSRALDWKMLTYFMAMWNFLRTFGKFYDHLVHFELIWYIFSVLVSRTNNNLATLLLSRDAPKSKTKPP
jgi:hypothetical protein